MKDYQLKIMKIKALLREAKYIEAYLSLEELHTEHLEDLNKER